MGIAEQMGKTLQRTSVSTNIKERLDFSCALFGVRYLYVLLIVEFLICPILARRWIGSQCTSSAGPPWSYARSCHMANSTSRYVFFFYRIVGHLVLCRRRLERRRSASFQPSFIRGQPSTGYYRNHSRTFYYYVRISNNIHLKVYHNGKAVFYVASRGHHADIGGITPGFIRVLMLVLIYILKLGSMPPFSKTLAEEGAAIESYKLVKNGVFQEEGVREVLKHSRNLSDNISDLKAQVYLIWLFFVNYLSISLGCCK